jgi:uncharacterized membrane protein YfcA
VSDEPIQTDQGSDGPRSAEKKTKPRKPRINGPAVLVFGFMGVVLGMSIDSLTAFIYVGVFLMLVGAYGVWALKRYERAEGIEEKLPGAGRYDKDGKVRDDQS